MRRILLALALGLLVVLAAATTTTLLSSKTETVVASRTIGNMTTTATPAVVPAGGTVRITLTVGGPAQYDMCRPFGLWATDSANHRAWTEVQFWMCPLYQNPGTIPAGKSQTFSFDWSTRGLAPGGYTVHGWFGLNPAPRGENIPPVTVDISR